MKVYVSEPVFLRINSSAYSGPSFQSTIDDLIKNSFALLQELVEDALDDELEELYGPDLLISSTVEYEIDDRALPLIKEIQSKVNLNFRQAATLFLLVVEVYLLNLYRMT
jgi:hypothetical protein